MLFDVELEDDQSVEAEGTAQQQQQQSGSYDGSSSSSNGSSVSLGSAVVNLDQLTEDVIQVGRYSMGHASPRLLQPWLLLLLYG